jgi:hypothetical protein
MSDVSLSLGLEIGNNSPWLEQGGDFFVSFYIYSGKADNRPTLMNSTINHYVDNARKSEVYVRLTAYCLFQGGQGCLWHFRWQILFCTGNKNRKQN